MDIAAQLNQSLPIKVTNEDVERNPQFTKLLQILTTKHLDKNGLSMRHSQELGKLKMTLRREKIRFFQKSIIVEELKMVLQSALHEKSADDISPSDRALYRRVDHMLCVAQAEHLLNISQNPKDNTLNVFDISPEFMHEVQLEDDHEAMAQVHDFYKLKIAPELHKRLTERHHNLAQFFDPLDTSGGGNNNATDYFSQSVFDVSYGNSSMLFQTNDTTTKHTDADLSHLVSVHLERIEQQSESLNQKVQLLDAQIWFLYKQLVGCLQKLGQILKEFKLSHSKDNFKMNLEWTREKVQTMLLKLSVIKYQYLTETYDAETVLMLRKLRSMMEKRYQEIQNEGFIVDSKLEQYRRIGGEFDSLVDEYRHILVEIENSYNFLDKLQNHS